MFTRIIGLLALVIALTSPVGFANDSPVTPKGRVMIVLDCSGSMAEGLGAGSRMDAAKAALGGLLPALGDSDVEVGLLAYGHRKNGDCQDIEILVQPADDASGAIARRIKGLAPRGKTPLAAAIERGGKSLLAAGDVQVRLIVVTDGLETCGGNPTLAAKNLVAMGVDVKVHVVGLAISDADAIVLAGIAKAGNGDYYHARDAAGLEASFEEVRVRIEKEVVTPVASPSKAPKPAAGPADFIDSFDRAELGADWRILAPNDESCVMDEGTFLALSEGAVKTGEGETFPNTLELVRELPKNFAVEVEVTFAMNPPTPTDDDGNKQTFSIDLFQDGDHKVSFDYTLWRAWNGYHVGAGYSLTKKGKTSRRPMGNIHIGNHAVKHEVTLKIRIEKNKRNIACTVVREVDGGKAQTLDLGFYKVLKLKPKLRIASGNIDAGWPSAELKIDKVSVKAL